MTTTERDSRWGYFVAVLFGGFVVFILACVGFASYQRFDLVDKQYYERGIAHQGRIDEMERVSTLAQPPTIAYDHAGNALVVAFPSSFRPQEVSGEVVLFRPSNSSYDRTVTLALGVDGIQRADMSSLPKGKWNAKMKWRYLDSAYYQEQTFIVE